MATSPTSAEPPARPPVRVGAYAWYALFVLVIVYALNFIDRQILSILAEDIKRDLGLEDAQIGFLAAPPLRSFTPCSDSARAAGGQLDRGRSGERADAVASMTAFRFGLASPCLRSPGLASASARRRIAEPFDDSTGFPGESGDRALIYSSGRT